MNHGQTDDASPFSLMAANFESRGEPCVGIVEPLKQVLRVTAHLKILAFELQAPIGACLGQYGIHRSLSTVLPTVILIIPDCPSTGTMNCDGGSGLAVALQI